MAPMERALAYVISAGIVGFGVWILIVGLSTIAPALWACAALIPIAIGLLSAFDPVNRHFTRVCPDLASPEGAWNHAIGRRRARSATKGRRAAWWTAVMRGLLIGVSNLEERRFGKRPT